MSVDDEEGLELPDLEAAHDRAVKYVRESVLEQKKLNLHHCIEVADEQGEPVLTVAFGDVVTIET